MEGLEKAFNCMAALLLRIFDNRSIDIKHVNLNWSPHKPKTQPIPAGNPSRVIAKNGHCIGQPLDDLASSQWNDIDQEYTTGLTNTKAPCSPSSAVRWKPIASSFAGDMCSGSKQKVNGTTKRRLTRRRRGTLLLAPLAVLAAALSLVSIRKPRGKRKGLASAAAFLTTSWAIVYRLEESRAKPGKPNAKKTQPGWPHSLS